MPAQDLKRAPAPMRRRASGGWRVHAARLTSFGGAALLTAFAGWQVSLAFDLARLTWLQAALGILFVLTFAWIAFSGASAVAGVLFAPPSRRAPSTGPLRSRTAILMPVYNEDPAETCGALAALGRGLAELGHAQAFEIFVLSDTRDADAWVRETTAFAALRRALGRGPVAWYRRRAENVGRKAGNVQEFVERWGGRYDHMLVLDADSVMAPETVVDMVRRMEAEPELGLLQTVPVLLGGETLFSRLQAFASRLYGGVAARAMAAWSGDDGNYWGHNAVIRTEAFAACAGLPVLEGRKPFGGHVLSHDFVEAALLRRAGWAVRIDPGLGGSWEGAPPSLLDAATRDRRWAQGNLQHSKIIGARGLRWPSRVHFGIGIGAYVASPLWLLMLVVGLAVTAQSTWFRPEYFPRAFQLFPSWPRFDAVRMSWLFVGSLALLLAPKILGLLGGLMSRARRESFGGGLRLTAGALVEAVLTALIAPVMMLMQSRHVTEILLGRDGGWNPQVRSGGVLPWRGALAAHAGHAALGLGVAAALAATQAEVLVWLSPVLLGLALAPVLSRWSGRSLPGGRSRLFILPEDRRPPPELVRSRELAEAITGGMADGLADLARNRQLAQAHIDALTPPPARARDPDLARITAEAKIDAATDPAQALDWLDAEERVALAADARTLRRWSPALRASLPRSFPGSESIA